MGKATGKYMMQLALLLFLLEVTVPTPAQSLDLHHLRKGGCPPITKFPTSVKVSMNMSMHESHDLSGSVRKRSISPWEYSYDVNNNRFPSRIPEAKCLHTRCLDAQGDLDNSMNSVPIIREILVLQREMRGCVPIFKLEKLMVTVGCTCVRPITQDQQ